jgi:hypothetical protein
VAEEQISPEVRDMPFKSSVLGIKPLSLNRPQFAKLFVTATRGGALALTRRITWPAG